MVPYAVCCPPFARADAVRISGVGVDRACARRLSSEVTQVFDASICELATVVRMSRLDEAQQRLNAALTRLERAVEAKAKAAQKNGASEADSAQLDALKAENEQLRQASAEAGERLDTAIRRLEDVLES